MFWFRVLAIAQVALLVRHHVALLERDERNRLAMLVAQSKGRPHKQPLGERARGAVAPGAEAGAGRVRARRLGRRARQAARKVLTGSGPWL